MIKNLKKLPMDIINKIFSYYYSPQPKELLEDIRNYSKTLKIIERLYYDFWIANWPSEFIPTPGQDKDWLINDLFAYANKDKALCEGYITTFYNLWIDYLLEHIWGKTNLPNGSIYMPGIGTSQVTCPKEKKYKDFINKFIYCMEKKNSITQTRFFWGVFSPAMRNDFVKKKLALIKTNYL